MTTTTQVRMIEVKSSNIHSIGYCKETFRLYVRFSDGMRLYAYESVPSVVWDTFQQAKSKGTFFQEQIKNHFECRRVDELANL